METEQSTLKTRVTKFKIDSTRAGEIEAIAKDIKTMFTSRYDFVNECFHLWIKFWTEPEEAVMVQQSWLPHYTQDMLDEMSDMMNEKEFEATTANLPQQRALLKEQDFEPSVPGFMWYKPDSSAVEDINQIIKPGTKASFKYQTPQEFFDDAIGMFITWWSSPKKSRDKMFEMWPYFPDESMDHWRNHKDYKQSFKGMEAQRRAWCKERKIDPDWIPGKLDKAEVTNLIKSKVKRVERGIARQTLGFQESVSAPSDMQTISNDALRSWNRLCTERENKESDVQRLDLSTPTADVLPYDHYPLIWDFYTRFLPVKIVLTHLGNMIVDEESKMVDYELFRDEAYDAALGISDILRETEERVGRKRNEKLSTGLPSPPIGINSKDKEKIRKKVGASKERFKNHFIGMKEKVWAKRKNDTGSDWFDGALNAMGLVYFVAKKVGKEAPSKGGKSKWKIQVGLTELGKDFWMLPNSIIDQYQDRIPPAEWKYAFYEKEIKFIRERIITRFPLENRIVESVLDRLKKISGEDETYLTAPEINKFYWPPVLDWVKQKENEKTGHYKNIESVFKKKNYVLQFMNKKGSWEEHDSFQDKEKALEVQTSFESENQTKCRIISLKEDLDYPVWRSSAQLDEDSSVSAWRAATMGRLSELNLVEWRIGDKDSGHQGISKFCLKKPKK